MSNSNARYNSDAIRKSFTTAVSIVTLLPLLRFSETSPQSSETIFWRVSYAGGRIIHCSHETIEFSQEGLFCNQLWLVDANWDRL